MGGGEGSVRWDYKGLNIKAQSQKKRRIGWREEFCVDACIERHPMIDIFIAEAKAIREALLKACPIALRALEMVGGEVRDVVRFSDAGVKIKKDLWSAASWALGDLEDRALMAFQKFLRGRGYIIGVLCSDGLMVHETADRGPIPRSTLDEAENAMLESLCDKVSGVRIRLERKEMETDGVAAWLAKAREKKGGS